MNLKHKHKNARGVWTRSTSMPIVIEISGRSPPYTCASQTGHMSGSCLGVMRRYCRRFSYLINSMACFQSFGELVCVCKDTYGCLMIVYLFICLRVCLMGFLYVLFIVGSSGKRWRILMLLNHNNKIIIAKYLLAPLFPEPFSPQYIYIVSTICIWFLGGTLCRFVPFWGMFFVDKNFFFIYLF